MLAGAYALRELVLTASAGDPFVGANVRRIRVLAGLSMVYAAGSLARAVVSVALQEHLNLDQISTTMSFAPLAWAMVLAALAEIWQRGVDMREEQALVV